MSQMRLTSVWAYREIQAEGKPIPQREKIRRLLSHAPDGLTRREISQILKLPEKTVTPRVHELINHHCIAMIDGTRLDRYSNKRKEIIKLVRN